MEQIQEFLARSIDWTYVVSILLVNRFVFYATANITARKRYFLRHLVFPNPDAQAKTWITVVNSALLGVIFFALFSDEQDNEKKYAINLVLTFCVTTTFYDIAMKNLLDLLEKLLTTKPADGPPQH